MTERNEIVSGDSFWKDIEKLPHEAQKKFADLLPLLVEDAFDPRLHTKALTASLNGKYSSRIMRDWRLVFVFEGDHRVRLLIAGRRDSIYERLKRIS